MKNRNFTTILLVVFVLFGQNVFAQNASDLLKKVQKKYDSFTSVCAQFKQTFHWQLADETQIVEGNICVQEGTKFRIETKDQDIISDGKTIWTINKINKQVIVKVADDDENDNPFLKNFIQKYIDNYSASVAGKDGDIVNLILKSKSENEFYPTINLWINQKSNFLSKIQQLDINENSTTYEILSIDERATIEKASFKFTGLEGYEIIDLQ